LRELGDAALLDEDGLAGKDVDDVLEAELDQGDGFRGEEVVDGAFDGFRRTGSEAERADAVLVAGRS
jgi:hypothetical protein